MIARKARSVLSRASAVATMAACIATTSSGNAIAQGVVALVCDIEEAYRPAHHVVGTPLPWRRRGQESFIVDLRQQKPFTDGSCCRIDAPSHHIVVVQDRFIFRNKDLPRESFSIDRYTGRLRGAMGVSGTFVRGTCKQGRRQF